MQWRLAQRRDEMACSHRPVTRTPPPPPRRRLGARTQTGVMQTPVSKPRCVGESDRFGQTFCSQVSSLRHCSWRWLWSGRRVPARFSSLCELLSRGFKSRLHLRQTVLWLTCHFSLEFSYYTFVQLCEHMPLTVRVAFLKNFKVNIK